MLRRAIISAVTIFILVTAPAAAAQYRRPEPRKTPRAVAVLEIDKKGTPRLFPVAVMLEGKFFDGSLYLSKPAPMTLWSDTVYEAQKSGMPMGLFTVRTAARFGTLWFGEGVWKPFASTTDTKPQNEKQPKSPVLKRDDDDDRPVLKKPKTEPAAPAPPADKSGEAKPSQGASSPEDTDRPTLRRGKPPEGSQVKEDEPFRILDPAKTKLLFADVAETYLAVSDAGPSDNRPYDMQLTPDEQQRYGQQLARFAWAELKKFAGARTTFPANSVFSNVHIRSLDLDYSNNPLFVYTAEYKVTQSLKLPSGAPAQKDLTYYVTYVGRADMNGQIQKVFATATDSSHLDAYARFEFVDAVDADGDSRGDLLFREIDDIGRKYVLFRASPYWSKLFEGASGR